MKYLHIIIFLICVFENWLASGQNCPDCVLIFSCPKALEMVNGQTNLHLLKKAFCGFQDGKPKVCCSELTSAPINNRNIDGHPNLGLLPKDCGVISISKVVGGTEAKLYEYPWMVLISYNSRDGNKNFECGGTLINDRYVLTAAHCIKGLSIAGVRVGEHNIDLDYDCQGKPPDVICEGHIQDIGVEEKIIHKDYHGKPKVKNDIGLLRLKKRVDFSYKNAKAICLPVTSNLLSRYLGGMNGTVAGWGLTESHTTSPVLLAVRLPIYTQEDCSALYNRGNTAGDETENKLCAGERGKDSCNGDSGGPLMVPGEHEGKSRYIQQGIVSYGPRSCGSNFPGVYTEVSKYMDWILDNIRP